MNKSFLFNNHNIIKNHLKVNWKIILFATLFWSLITFLLLLVTLIGGKNGFKVPAIGDYVLTIDAPTHSSSTTIVSISSMLRWALFSGPGIVYFSIFIIFLINKVIIKEIKTAQINIWASQPVSRTNIFISKASFILLACTFVFAASFIIIIIFSLISYDVNKWLSFVFLYGIQMFLFIILLVSVYLIITFLLVEKEIIGNLICSLICFWIIATWVAQMIYEMSNEEITQLSFIKYISPQSLIVNTLYFLRDVENTINIPDFDLRIDILKNTGFSVPLLVSFTILMPILSFGMLIINNVIFVNKDLNI